MTTGTAWPPRTPVVVRVTRDVHNELLRLQREFYEQHQVRPSLSAVIARLLADRKAARP